jgi:hypothetical protein
MRSGRALGVSEPSFRIAGDVALQAAALSADCQSGRTRHIGVFLSSFSVRVSAQLIPEHRKSQSNLERSIWCWVLGEEPPSRMIFSVQISHQATIDLLKEAIKEKNRVTFDHVDARTLRLDKILVAIGDLDATLSYIDPDALENELLPTQQLSQVFADFPTDGYLHIVVQLPGVGCFFGLHVRQE